MKRFNTYKDDEYINGIPTLYIRNKRLTPGEISVLALLIIPVQLNNSLIYWNIKHTMEALQSTDSNPIQETL